MQRFFLTVFCALVIQALLFRCEKSPDPTATGTTIVFKVDRGGFQIPVEGVTEAIHVTASGSWTCTTDKTWIHLSTAGETGDAVVSVVVDPNESFSTRSGTIRLKAEGADAVVVTIQQSALSGKFSISRTALKEGPHAATDTIRIRSTIAWTLTTSQPWLTTNVTSGTGDQLIELSTTANYSTTPGTATINITGTGTTDVLVVTVTQRAGIAQVAGGTGGGTSLTLLGLPVGLWLEDDGDMIISEAFADRVVRWPLDGTTGVVLAGWNGRGAALNQLSRPGGFFRDTNGDLYIADTGNSRIVKWAAGATAGTVVAGGNGAGTGFNQTNEPEGVVLTGGYLYITEGLIDRVSRWTPGAISGINVVGDLTRYEATFIHLDNNGNFYVSSGEMARVSKYTPGNITGTVVAGDNGIGTALNQFSRPTGIFVDENDNVYVSDSGNGNGRVMKWAPGATTGVVVAGGNGDGNGLLQLRSPMGIWVDDHGNLYICDMGNHRVMRWLLSP